MLPYLAKRLAGLVIVLLAMSFLVFCLQTLVPSDPERTLAGPMAPAATLASIREKLGIDDPVLVQYGRFLAQIVEGDLGTSIRTRKPVLEDIGKYFPASAELGLIALLFGLVFGGLLALVQNAASQSSLLRLGIIGAGSAPIFLSGLLLAYIFWFQLGWFPGAGRLSTRGFVGPTDFLVFDGLLAGRLDISLDALAHLILPGLTLSLPIAVAVGRSLGASLQDVMRQPYIRTMRGKGPGEAEVLLRHGLRNAASAPLAMVGLQVGLMFGNLLVVERIFAWPGLGLYMVQAFAASDLPSILGVSLVFGLIYILFNILVEIAQSLADPRIVLNRSRP